MAGFLWNGINPQAVLSFLAGSAVVGLGSESFKVVFTKKL
jgi:hypothetical protein